MEINLFEKRLGKLKNKLKLKLLLTRSIIFWVLLMAVIMILISGWSLMVNRDNLKVNQQIKLTKQGIEELQKIESQQVYLTSKLSSFKQIVKFQELHQAVTETIFAVIPAGTELKGFNVETDGEIRLSGSVPDYFILSELFERIKKADDYRLPIKSAKVNRIVVDQEGGISFDINLEIQV